MGTPILAGKLWGFEAGADLVFHNTSCDMRILNGSVILQTGISKKTSIIIKNGRISRIGRGFNPPGMNTIDADGLFVSPGFIDSHIHGDPKKVFDREIKFGTTGIVSAISCGPSEEITAAVKSAKRFKADKAIGDFLLGMRMEGPFINKVRAGAQDKRFIARPSPRLLEVIISKFGGLLKMMTLAPEIEGVREMIPVLKRKRIIASLGHSDADYKEGIGGIDAGITHATHLFNGMRKPAGKKDSAALACLSDKRAGVEIIFDLVHVSKRLLRLALSMKNKKDIILITDSVRSESSGRAAKGGVFRLEDGTISGSNLTMIEAVRNAVKRCGVALTDAINFASINPARLLGVDRRKGSIAIGKNADLVIFDKDFNVKMTMLHGRIIYKGELCAGLSDISEIGAPRM